MKYLLLVSDIAGITAQNIFSKQYDLKCKKQNVFIFTAVLSFFAMLFFVISSGGKLNFNAEFLLYSIGFGIAYGAATAGQVYAIKTGSLSISMLIMSYSLIIPTMYGIAFLKEPVRMSTYIGIALLMISLFMVNMKKEDAKFSLVWIMWLIISFVGNGMCSTVQKMQQLHFDGAYKSEFMIAALAVVIVISLVIGFLQPGNKKEEFVGCLKYAPISGIANGIVNLLTMVLTAVIPNAVLFPSLSAGGIVLTFIISLAIYKEKLTKMQIIGYFVGTASVIILSL